MSAAKKALSFCAVGLSMAVSVAFVEVASAEEKFILAHHFGTDHFVNPVAIAFSEKLSAESGGELVVDNHPGGDLGDYIQQFEKTMRGGIPMMLTGPATDMDARLNVSHLAYIADDWTSARKLYGPGGSIIATLDKVAADLNLKLLGMIPGGFAGIATRKGEDRRPVNFPEDGKGFKMRVPPFEIGVKRFEAWGFSPVPIRYSELFTALQLGTVDGRSFGLPTEIIEMRDAISAYIRTRDYFDTAFWIVNRTWWDGLTDQKRAWIEKAANEAMASSWEAGEAKELADLQRLRDYNIEVIELSPEQLEKAKKIIYDKEWPWMQTVVGDQFMSDVRKAAGVQ